MEWLPADFPALPQNFQKYTSILGAWAATDVKVWKLQSGIYNRAYPIIQVKWEFRATEKLYTRMYVSMFATARPAYYWVMCLASVNVNCKHVSQ